LFIDGHVASPRRQSLRRQGPVPFLPFRCARSAARRCAPKGSATRSFWCARSAARLAPQRAPNSSAARWLRAQRRTPRASARAKHLSRPLLLRVRAKRRTLRAQARAKQLSRMPGNSSSPPNFGTIRSRSANKELTPQELADPGGRPSQPNACDAERRSRLHAQLFTARLKPGGL
jgi:hypothetical protein